MIFIPTKSFFLFFQNGKKHGLNFTCLFDLYPSVPGSLENESPGRFLQSRAPTPPPSQNVGSSVGHAGSALGEAVTVRACLQEARMASDSHLGLASLCLCMSPSLVCASWSHLLIVSSLSKSTVSCHPYIPVACTVLCRGRTLNTCMYSE